MKHGVAAAASVILLALAPGVASAEPLGPAPGCEEFGRIVSAVVTEFYTGPEPQFEGFRWGHAISDLAQADTADLFFQGNPLGISRQGICTAAP